MDQPKTRKETKKDQKEKARGKSIYTAKHVRLVEGLKENHLKRNGFISQQTANYGNAANPSQRRC
jgi:hypothetical protein